MVTGTEVKSSKRLSVNGKDELTKRVIRRYFANGLADALKNIKKAFAI